LKCSTLDMVKYSTGDVSTSLTLNSLFGFAMVYYTQALGLSPVWAGLAMGLATFWEAVSDPIMGYITDITRSKHGRYHPYMFIGGITMMLVFFFLWKVPAFFLVTKVLLFCYLVVMNLLLRTLFTVFFIPYTALGFEICTDYDGRSKLQGIRLAMNMLANLLGPALSWTIFFSQTPQQKAAGIEPNSIAANYVNMGTGFTAAGLLFVLYCCIATYKYKQDSRNLQTGSTGIAGFFKEMLGILKDKNARSVYLFLFIALVGVAMVSVFQMFCYIHFLACTAFMKTLIHGSSMVGMGIGGLISQYMVRFLSKRGAIVVAVIWNVSCNVILAILYLPGIIEPQAICRIYSFDVPYGFGIFMFFHAAFWVSNGVLLATSAAMIADVSEINLLKTNINKDGSYSSVLCFVNKLAISVAIFIAGFVLSGIGIEGHTGSGTYAKDTIWRLGAVTVLSGPIVSIFALLPVWSYPITREYLKNAREEAACVKCK